jgi:hypothetical protein
MRRIAACWLPIFAADYCAPASASPLKRMLGPALISHAVSLEVGPPPGVCVPTAQAKSPTQDPGRLWVVSEIIPIAFDLDGG